MIRTRVGYAGGTTPHPTYRDIGDHSEVVEIDYDPAVLGYDDLLDIFWLSHDPRRPAPSRQYRSAILYCTEEERLAAEASRARVTSRIGPVTTTIEPLEGFHRAEDYHQKYYLRSRKDLAGGLIEAAGSDREMVDSTAAARLNAWLGGNSDEEDVAEWLPRLESGERSAR